MADVKSFNSIKDFLNPSITGLLVWDVQNMLVENIFNKEEFLKQNNLLIELARKLNIPVFFSKITPLTGRFESPVRKFMMQQRKRKLDMKPDGMDLAIKTVQQDVVINKNTASMFIGTNFELMLKNAGIITVIITGIATEFGVESSARDAANRGFMPVIASDAVSSYDKEAHGRSLENMKNMFPVMSVENIIENLK
jgi:nicotinamidase-related amidase